MDRATREALDEALDDEHKARATYAAVIERFGELRPFTNIIESEQRHIDALLSIYRRHQLEPPPDRWAGRVEAPASVEEACRQGVAAERDNDAMYVRLLERVDDPNIRAVLARLQEASRERHLPAFERCLGRERGPGAGGGRRRRRRGRCGGG